MSVELFVLMYLLFAIIVNYIIDFKYKIFNRKRWLLQGIVLFMPCFNFVLVIFSSLIFVFLRFISDELLDTLLYLAIVCCALVNFKLTTILLSFKFKSHINFSRSYYFLLAYPNLIICLYLLWFWFDFEQNWHASFGF